MIYRSITIFGHCRPSYEFVWKNCYPKSLYIYFYTPQTQDIYLEYLPSEIILNKGIVTFYFLFQTVLTLWYSI